MPSILLPPPLAVFRPEASGKVLPLSTFIGWLRISGIGRVRISGTHTKWSQGPGWNRDFDNEKSVPLLRSMVQQYKIDLHNKVQSHITKAQFERASSIRSIKAPELRKRVRAALKPFGHYETDVLGNYWCGKGKQKFSVNVDFGGRSAQLRYSVVRPEFRGVHSHSQFRFERAMGFGLGDWNYIVEENVDAVFSLFAEVVQYSFELPDRIRTATK